MFIAGFIVIPINFEDLSVRWQLCDELLLVFFLTSFIMCILCVRYLISSILSSPYWRYMVFLYIIHYTYYKKNIKWSWLAFVLLIPLFQLINRVLVRLLLRQLILFTGSFWKAPRCCIFSWNPLLFLALPITIRESTRHFQYFQKISKMRLIRVFFQ